MSYGVNISWCSFWVEQNGKRLVFYRKEGTGLPERLKSDDAITFYDKHDIEFAVFSGVDNRYPKECFCFVGGHGYEFYILTNEVLEETRIRFLRERAKMKNGRDVNKP